MSDLLAVRRNLAPAGLSLLAGLALLSGVDLGAGRAHVSAAEPFSAPLFQGFGRLDPELGSRIAGADSELRLAGFPAGAEVALELRLSTAWRRPFDAAVWVNGVLASRQRVRGVPETVSARGTADGSGELRLRFSGAESAAAVHFYELDATWQSRAWRLPRAALALLAPLLLLALLGAWGGESVRGVCAWVLGAALALALALDLARLTLLAQGHCLTACALAGLAIALLCSMLGLARGWMRWYVVAAILRIGLVAQSDFPCIDCLSHHQGYLRFWHGQVNVSIAPGPVSGGFAVPYPPGVYAALQPIYALTGRHVGRSVVRYGILALEVMAPLLLAGVLCAGGASRRAAAAAAAALAACPEGLLVSAKGIAANAFGAEVTILALWALARPQTSTMTLAGLFALGLLSHVGAAATLLAAALFFLLRRIKQDPRSMQQGAVALVLAAALAWWAYYGEVWALAMSAAGTVQASAQVFGLEGWTVRWFRVGKTLQDLVLKFGVGPLVLCWVGWRRGLLPERLRQLATSCLVVAGLTGLVACLTPYPLRFEYFALPAVALLAGAGAEAWERTGRAGLAHAAIALALCVQAVVGVGLLRGWLDPIDVIIESPRWPARERLLAALFGW